MCGIAGLISFSGINEKNIVEVQQINEALIHRGPDGGAIYSDENVVLGHRRLSIIDLSEEANQPMESVDGNLIIVFNGEVYNHEELKKQLIPDYPFKTGHSDTEVILNAYKKWGMDCLNYLKGMFAFCLYDKLKSEAYLVRDRFGKKPLYYSKVDGQFYFSSEIQSLFKSGVVEKRINDDAIYHYLTFLTINSPNTFFKNINKLKAGHYLKLTPSSMNEVRYWDVAEYLNQPNRNISEEEALKKTEQYLEQSIKYRFVADVPVSIALSGGLDSSLNLFYAKKLGVDVSAINLSFNEKDEFDESEIAKKYADELGIKLHQITIDNTGFENLIQEYLEIQQDMPIGDPNFCLLYGISKHSRKIGSKVMLVGEGGDEIGGYPVYENILKEYELYKKSPALVNLAKNLLPSKKLKSKLDFIQKDKFISRRHFHGFTEFDKKEFWQKNIPKTNSYDVIHSYMEQVNAPDLLKKIINVEYKLRLPELILPRVDYPSMAASIEARSPFMDSDWIEFNATLPFEMIMKRGPKSMLRAVAKNKLPDYILNHQKVGFGMLLTPFLNDTLPVWFENELIKEDAPIKEYVKESFLINIHKSHQKSLNYGFKLWVLFALNKWLIVNDTKN